MAKETKGNHFAKYIFYVAFTESCESGKDCSRKLNEDYSKWYCLHLVWYHSTNHFYDSFIRVSNFFT